MVQCGALRADVPVLARLGDRDRLATRASPLPQVQARVVARHAPLRLRSGDMPERGALGPLLVIRHPPTGTVARNPAHPAPVPPVLLAQPYRRCSPALSKLSPKSFVGQSNKTVLHMRHCFCTHSSGTSCKIRTERTYAQSLSPLPTVKRSKSNTQHSRCSEEVCSPVIAPVIHGPSMLILSRRSGNAAAVGRGAQGCRGRGFLHRPAGCRNGCRSVSLYVPVLSLLQKWCCEALASLVWILDSR